VQTGNPWFVIDSWALPGNQKNKKNCPPSPTGSLSIHCPRRRHSSCVPHTKGVPWVTPFAGGRQTSNTPNLANRPECVNAATSGKKGMCVYEFAPAADMEARFRLTLCTTLSERRAGLIGFLADDLPSASDSDPCRAFLGILEDHPVYACRAPGPFCAEESGRGFRW